MNMFFHLTIISVLLYSAISKIQHDPDKPLPSFGDPVQNITVIKGRDIIFTCIVKHLGPYKVGWVKADTKAIQAIHHQVVTHNPRVSVSYRDRTTWNLHIKNVQEDDRGVYMCQVNTDPMIAEMAFLEVVVPPEIMDEKSSGESVVEEGGSITLACKARGHPTPKVSWQREGNEKIVLREHGTKKVATVSGELLKLRKVKRQDMGPYLCIGKNGIPPSVSKRIMLRINFKPMMDVPVHMIGSPTGNDVTITCNVESSPKAVNTWRKIPGEQMIIDSAKYNVTEEVVGYYVTKVHLMIRNFTKHDATNYICSASNSLGYAESTIQVYEIPSPNLETSVEEEIVETNEIETSGHTHKKDSFIPSERSHVETLLDQMDIVEYSYDELNQRPENPPGIIHGSPEYIEDQKKRMQASHISNIFGIASSSSNLPALWRVRSSLTACGVLVISFLEWIRKF